MRRSLCAAYHIERSIAKRLGLPEYPCSCNRYGGSSIRKVETVARHHITHGRDPYLVYPVMVSPTFSMNILRSLFALRYNVCEILSIHLSCLLCLLACKSITPSMSKFGNQNTPARVRSGTTVIVKWSNKNQYFQFLGLHVSTIICIGYPVENFVDPCVQSNIVYLDLRNCLVRIHEVQVSHFHPQYSIY